MKPRGSLSSKVLGPGTLSDQVDSSPPPSSWLRVAAARARQGGLVLTCCLSASTWATPENPATYGYHPFLPATFVSPDDNFLLYKLCLLLRSLVHAFI